MLRLLGPGHGHWKESYMIGDNSGSIDNHRILEMARELGMALSDSKILVDYREAELKVANSPKSTGLIREFKSLNARVNEMKEKRIPSKDIESVYNHLLETDKKMKEDPHISEFYRIGAELNSLIGQINAILKFYTMGDEEKGSFISNNRTGCSDCDGKCH